MWRLLGLLLCCQSLLSCATLVSGTTESIAVTSSPAGADATLTCGGRAAGSGVTPTTITIRRNAGTCDLRLTKDGFDEATIRIEQGVNPVYWSNMLFSPLAPVGLYVVLGGDSSEKGIGAAMLGTAIVVFGTDFWTGAAHLHRPGTIDAVLKAKD